MKKIAIILLLLTQYFNYGQEVEGTVKYGLIIADDESFDKGPAGEFLQVAKEAAKNLSYTLTFDENTSMFCLDESLDFNGSSIASAFSGINGKYYNIKESFSLLNEIDEQGVGTIIVASKYDYHWDLSDESKKIDGFQCFKASRIKNIDNGDAGIFERTITVWYCPELPVSFGPAGEGGLPGLILELHNRNITIGVKKIDLSIINKYLLNLPTKGKWMSEQDYSKMLDEKLDEN